MNQHRRPSSSIKKTKEDIIINEFLRINGFLEDGSKIDRTMKFPDCLVTKKNGSSTWIEVTSIHANGKLIKKLDEDADELLDFERPLVRSGGREITQQFSPAGTEQELQEWLIKEIKAAIEKKNSKPNYASLTEQYGKGILLIFIDTSICRQRHLEKITNHILYKGLKINNFDCIYLFDWLLCPFDSAEQFFKTYAKIKTEPFSLPNSQFILLWKQTEE